MSSHSKFAFFRQSGWMVIATFVGGIFMGPLVHMVAAKMGTQEYSTFVALLSLLIMLGIPGSALRTVFAKQAAAAVADEKRHQLAGTARAILRWTFLLWIGLAILFVFFAKPVSQFLKVNNIAALYLTVSLALPALWCPILKGILQGRHQFAGLGWLQLIDGMCRFG